VLAATAADIAAAHELGLLVDVWTVDDAQEIRTVVANGVDAIITNEPDHARNALVPS